MTQQYGSNNEAFDAIVAPLAAERTQEWSMNGFGDLYVSERDRLVELATRYTKDRAEAEDIVQDAFLKCALAAPDLANRDHAVAYLTRTVVNTALNVVKAGSRRATPVEDLTTAPLDSREIDAWNPAADEAVMQAADTALVTEALSRLTDTQRTALLMTASGDYSTKQVAEALGVSEQQVYTHVSRARAALRRALESIVVDAETGMTAADQLSHVVTKAKKNAKQVGQTMAAIFLVMAVGLGFWNFNSAPTLQQFTQQAIKPATPKSNAPKATAPKATPVAPKVAKAKANTAAANAEINRISAELNSLQAAAPAVQNGYLRAASKASKALDSAMVTLQVAQATRALLAQPGAPVALESGFALTGVETTIEAKGFSTSIENGLSARYIAGTALGALDLTQSIVRDGGAIRLTVAPSYDPGATQLVAVGSSRTASGDIRIDATLLAVRPVLASGEMPQAFAITLIVDSNLSTLKAETVYVLPRAYSFPGVSGAASVLIPLPDASPGQV